MSSLVIQRVKIDEVKPHPNADRLQVLTVLGWQLVSQKGLWHVGDPAIYIPPDSVLPVELSDKLEVTKYLSKGRIKVAKLRGENSFGLLLNAEMAEGVPDDKLAEHFGITKYEPPIKFQANDAAESPFWFHKFTDMENIRNYPTVFENQLVLITEKLDGTAFRVGFDGLNWFAGSKNYARKQGGVYWMPFEDINLRAMMAQMYLDTPYANQKIMVFGEIYGKGVPNGDKSMNYGTDKPKYAVYDISVDGKYIGAANMAYFCTNYEVPLVPPIAMMPFNLKAIKQMSEGKSNVAEHIREGVVVRTVDETQFPQIGRGIMKYVSDTYLGTAETDFTDS